MSDVTRREVLVGIAAAFAASGVVDPLALSETHAWAAQAPGTPYTPKALSLQEFRALERLVDLIIPVEGSKPGALEAGVPAWIDTMLTVSEALKARYVSGLAWIHATMRARQAADFASATPAQQTDLLDQIAFKKNASPELNAGIEFFTLARRMTVDGFYTSPMGMRDIYQGNQARPSFAIPQEAMDYVIGRSPLKSAGQ